MSSLIFTKKTRHIKLIFCILLEKIMFAHTLMELLSKVHTCSQSQYPSSFAKFNMVSSSTLSLRGMLKIMAMVKAIIEEFFSY